MNIPNLKEFCENSPLICHHAQFEHKWLLYHGIDANIDDDTMLLAYIYDESLPLDLESLCLKFNIDTIFKEEYGKDVSKLKGKRLVERNIRDARNTKLLRDFLWDELSDKEKNVYKTVLLPAAKTLAFMENQGVCYSPTILQEVLDELDKNIIELGLHDDPVIKEFEEKSNKKFNIDSWIHRGIVIYDLLGYEPLPYPQATTSSGNPSTNSKVLKKMLERRHTDTLEKIIKFSSYNGWKENYENLESYCDKCSSPHVLKDKNGTNLLFTSLSMGATTTGRIKSSHPNMQNNPSRDGGWTRKLFVPRNKNGLIVEADYDGVELRILAGLSGDEKLLDNFRKGLDPHVEMAKTAFGISNVSDDERFNGKTLNFAIPFGSGANRIAFETGRSVKEAKIWLSRYWREHKQLKEYLSNIPESGIVTSPTGMKRHTNTWTEGKNFPIQNSALIALLVGLNRYVPEAGKYAEVDLCIHDSVRSDLREERNLGKLVGLIKETMEFEAEELYSWLPIPLTISVKAGKDWGSMEEV